MPAGARLSPPQRVYAAFFLYAMAIGGIFPRLGDLQQALQLSERTLGLALIGTASGTLVSLTLAAPWLERLGHRLVLLAGTTPTVVVPAPRLIARESSRRMAG